MSETESGGPVDPCAVVLGMEDPAFACDERGSIVAWNSASERLLGHRADDVTGLPCDSVLCGRDVFGNLYCTANCNPRQIAGGGSGMRRFLMDVRTAGGSFLRVTLHTIRVPGRGPNRFALVHVMDTDEEAGTKGFRRGRAPDLTPRELEVLRLLCDGIGTRLIAERLFISPSTTRKHIQNILAKMGAHSRLEAVCVALRGRLI